MYPVRTNPKERLLHADIFSEHSALPFTETPLERRNINPPMVMYETAFVSIRSTGSGFSKYDYSPALSLAIKTRRTASVDLATAPQLRLSAI